jgi:hypothetical protein
MQRVLANPISFFVLYLLFMLPTYVLPWLGSNSGMLNVAGAAAGAGVHPLLWVHLLTYVVLAGLAWLRGSLIGHAWLVALPVLAAVFDLVPGLNWIFLIPTILNVLCLILGVALKGPRAVRAA